MADENLTVENLFGETVYLGKRGRGRPPFEWTKENSNKVNMLLAMGWSNERIALCILNPKTGKPISNATLKRHFRAELSVRDTARDRLLARQLMVCSDVAFSGNVSAMRHLEELIAKNDLVLAEAAMADTTEKRPKLGKKELDAQLAEDADAELTAEIEAEAAQGARH